MNFNRCRRSLMLGLAAAGVGNAFLEGRAEAETQASGSSGYVLGPNQGEQLIQRGGSIFIKADPGRGSSSLAMGTQQVLAGVGIPVHRHFQMDEAFYVIEGSGTFILDDVRHPIEKGGSIFIPRNSWHGFENADRELLLLWMVTPPGLESFFREVASLPGAPAKSRTKEQLNEIARKYGTEFR